MVMPSFVSPPFLLVAQGPSGRIPPHSAIAVRGSRQIQDFR
jgi:hypothetical protein